MSELYLIAHLAGRGLAIDSRQVESVVDIEEVVAVPHAPDTLVGLAALRSRVVTVIDTRVALGLPPGERAGRAVIAQVDGHHYAFLVDALEDVAPLRRVPLAATASDGGWARASAGVVERDGEPLLVIDLAALLPAPAAAA